MARRYAFALPAACLLALAGCDTTPAAVDGGTDASTLPDATYRAPDSCDMTHLHVLDGMADGTVSLDLDTTMSTTRPRDLGPACGNPAPDIRWAPQEVVEFHVPGTGMQGVRFTTDSPSTTPINFNTVVQVRQGECRMIPTTSFPPTCFDDVDPATNLRSTGGITVMGGTTLYFIVTGYSSPPAGQMAVDHGVIHIDFTVGANTAPVLVSGTAQFTAADTIISATATDAEGPIAGFALSLYNATGGLDTNGDGMFDTGDSFLLSFDSVMSSAPNYTGHATISGATMYTFAAACRQAAVSCTQVGLRVFDQQYLLSAELRVNIEDLAANAECAAATDITIATPTTASTMTTVDGTTLATDGAFEGSCGGGRGRENIWHLVVPAGDYDLALTTDVGGTASDTVMYVRSACANAASELAMGCNDDINYPSNPRSHLTFRDLAPGDYFVFIDSYDGSAAAYHLQATLLPVLASGATCDPGLVDYRCHTGVCSATTMTCP